ncbi:MAG: efflux RND transporter periplasmic adaptor subunit [Isosphaeraceae bacterium]
MRNVYALLFSSIVFASAGCGSAPEATVARAQQEASGSARRVTAIKVAKGTLTRVSEEPGQVEPLESTPIHAKLAGYVRTVTVDIGDRVKAGQILAELDVPEVEADVQQRRALAEQAEAERAQAVAAQAVARAGVVTADAKAAHSSASFRRLEAEVARWQAEAARTEQLARDSAVTGSLRDETRSKLEAARGAFEEGKAEVLSADAARAEARAMVEKAEADLASATARVQVARAEVRRAEALFNYAKIVAPFDAVVTRRGVDPGWLTVPGGTADPLFVVSRVDQVTVVVAVPESDAAHVSAGDLARIRIPAHDNKVVDGKVSRSAFVLDHSTRTLRAEIDLPNPDGHLRPGLYAQVSVVADQRAGVLAVPVSAVVRDQGKTYCVIVASGKAARRPVTLGLSDGTRVEVISGLSEGDAVITSSTEGLSEGQAVEILPEKP